MRIGKMLHRLAFAVALPCRAALAAPALDKLNAAAKGPPDPIFDGTSSGRSTVVEFGSGLGPPAAAPRRFAAVGSSVDDREERRHADEKRRLREGSAKLGEQYGLAAGSVAGAIPGVFVGIGIGSWVGGALGIVAGLAGGLGVVLALGLLFAGLGRLLAARYYGVY